MGFDHSLNASIKLKQCISKAEALIVLKPLADECGWTAKEIFENDLIGDDTVTISWVSDDMISGIELCTCGEMPFHFPDVVYKFANGLADTAQANFIELRNHDTADLSNAISKIWYGTQAEIHSARKTHAWHLSLDILEAAGVQEQSLSMVRLASAGEFPVAADLTVKGHHRDSRSHHEAEPGSARLFWDELLLETESLAAIAETHGASTLADCMYLQNAIATGGFIDHEGAEESESKIVEIIGTLPSKHRWMTFVRNVENVPPLG